MNFLGFSLLSFFILTTTLASAQKESKHEHFKTVEKIERHVLLTIKSLGGDLIDKQNQPTFNHSLTMEKAIQKVPRQILGGKKYPRKSRINKASKIKLQNRTMNDTIPIRRSTVTDVMRVNSTSEFKTKQKSLQHQLPTKTVEDHEYASVIYDAEQVVYGAAATIKKEEPLVFGENEYSQAYVQIKTGSGSDFESIKVGWHVFPKLYSDDDDDDAADTVRLFLLWTTDGYQTTNCYNYECDGFEAISGDGGDDHEVVLPGEVLEISSDVPQDIHVKIWKDPQQRNWWLMIDDEVIGKWTNIFHRLGGPFTSVEWGGQVSNRDSQMGSGHFGRQENNGACYIRNLEIMLGNNPDHYVQVPFGELSIRETDPLLYDVSINNNQRYIYFGGPGSMTSNP